MKKLIDKFFKWLGYIPAKSKIPNGHIIETVCRPVILKDNFTLADSYISHVHIEDIKKNCAEYLGRKAAEYVHFEKIKVSEGTHYRYNATLMIYQNPNQQ